MSNTTLATYEPALLVPVAPAEQVIESHKQLTILINQSLVENQDYGKIPGAGDKKNLLKPGAERLCAAYALQPHFEIIEQDVDHGYKSEYSIVKWVDAKSKPSKDEEERLRATGKGRNKKTSKGWRWQTPHEENGIALGLYRYVIRCTLHRGGNIVGEGVGSCSSLESKYIRSPRDFENTVLKMAKKRAFVDATLTTLGLSDRFTQDIEDIRENEDAVTTEGVDYQETEIEQTEAVPDQRAIQVAEATAAIRRMSWSRDQFGDYKSLCKGYQLDWWVVLPQAIAEGCETYEDVVMFADGLNSVANPGSTIVEAEIVEEVVTVPTSAAEYDPLADVPTRNEIAALPDDKLQSDTEFTLDFLKWPRPVDAGFLTTATILRKTCGIDKVYNEKAGLDRADWVALYSLALEVQAGTKPEPAAIATWRKNEAVKEKSA